MHNTSWLFIAYVVYAYISLSLHTILKSITILPSPYLTCSAFHTPLPLRRLKFDVFVIIYLKLVACRLSLNYRQHNTFLLYPKSILPDPMMMLRHTVFVQGRYYRLDILFWVKIPLICYNDFITLVQVNYHINLTFIL